MPVNPCLQLLRLPWSLSSSSRLLPAIALLRFRHAQISFLFLGASSTPLSLSLSLSLSRFFFSSSSSQTWSHYKICCCERCYFQIAGDFSSFLGEVVGALGGSHLGQEQEQDPNCMWFSWGFFWVGGVFFWRGVFFLCLGCDQENQRVGILCGSNNNGGGDGRRRRRRKPGGERNQGFVAGEVCRHEWQQGQEKTHL